MIGGYWWVVAIAFWHLPKARDASLVPEFRGESYFDSPEADLRTEKQDNWLSQFSESLL